MVQPLIRLVSIPKKAIATPAAITFSGFSIAQFSNCTIGGVVFVRIGATVFLLLTMFVIVAPDLEKTPIKVISTLKTVDLFVN